MGFDYWWQVGWSERRCQTANSLNANFVHIVMYFHWHANTFLSSYWKSILWNGEESGYVTKPLKYAHFRTLEDKETDKYRANNFANPRQINRQILNANQSLSQPGNVMFNRKTDRNWIIYLIRECRSSCIRLIERVKLYHCMSAPRVCVCDCLCSDIWHSLSTSS